MGQKRPDPALVKKLGTYSTATISDALDKVGMPGGCLGIKPMVQGVRMAGTAFTVRYVPVGYVKGTVGDFLDDVAPGEVVVLDNKGRTDCTVWGDIMTVTAKIKGIAGTVIDGVCRDLPRILEERYPIFTCGSFMMTGKDRVMVESINEPVSIGNVQVRPGDILIGDDSGVVVIPQEVAGEVLKVAEVVEEAESRIVEAVNSGLSLKEARVKCGYHSLQTKGK
ncbi:MAG: RraA family protein [Deltaproteobacteria bacterium]|nr:RraA family protein [Deltaproteobacteria bacterium]